MDTKKKTILFSSIGLTALVLAILLAFVILPFKTSKFEIETNISATTYVDIDYDQYLTMREEEKSFVLYITNEYCFSCISVKPYINEVISDNHLIIYSLNDENIPSSDKMLTYVPAIVIIKQGKIKSNTNYLNDEKIYASSSSILKHLRKYVVIPVIE